MSMADKYVKDRPDDILPRTMKALNVGLVGSWAEWLKDAHHQKSLARTGKFVLLADPTRIPDPDVRNHLCRDVVKWFGEQGLEIQSTHPELDKKNEKHSEITFQMTLPDETKAQKLPSLLKKLCEVLQEQREMDAFYARK